MEKNELNKLWQNYKIQSSQEQALTQNELSELLEINAPLFSSQRLRNFAYQMSLYSFLICFCQAC